MGSIVHRSVPTASQFIGLLSTHVNEGACYALWASGILAGAGFPRRCFALVVLHLHRDLAVMFSGCVFRFARSNSVCPNDGDFLGFAFLLVGFVGCFLLTRFLCFGSFGLGDRRLKYGNLTPCGSTLWVRVKSDKSDMPFITVVYSLMRRRLVENILLAVRRICAL